MFVRFMDMHSHGYLKEPQQYIYIEADSEEQAEVIFYNRFGHNPHRVSCTCCGEDYSIDNGETLAKASYYDRGCRSVQVGAGRWEYREEWCEQHYRPYLSVDQYVNRDDVLVIYAKDISDDEREGDVPQEGYVWH